MAIDIQKELETLFKLYKIMNSVKNHLDNEYFLSEAKEMQRAILLVDLVTRLLNERQFTSRRMDDG